MRLLLTRPVDQSEASAARLRDLGHEVILTPVLEITPLPARWPEANFDGLLATSARAFAGLPGSAGFPARSLRRTNADSKETGTYPASGPGSPRDWAALPLFAAGEQTARAARHWRGKSAPVAVAPDAAALAKMLASHPPARLLYLAGQDRKPHLEQALAQAGHQVQVLETYAARPAPALGEAALAALRSGAVDGVLHYSPRSAAIFLRLADQAGAAAQAKALHHFCLSADVAAPLRLCGAGRVLVAARPDEDGLLGLLAAGPK